MKKLNGELVILPETYLTRAMTLRIDRFGVYLLFWNDGYMVAGFTIQYPEIITKNQFFLPGFSSFNSTHEEYLNMVEQHKSF